MKIFVKSWQYHLFCFSFVTPGFYTDVYCPTFVCGIEREINTSKGIKVTSKRMQQ